MQLIDHQKVLLEKAVEIFGSKEEARNWISNKEETLGGVPSEIAETELGLNRVLMYLHAIEGRLNHR